MIRTSKGWEACPPPTKRYTWQGRPEVTFLLPATLWPDLAAAAAGLGHRVAEVGPAPAPAALPVAGEVGAPPAFLEAVGRNPRGLIECRPGDEQLALLAALCAAFPGADVLVTTDAAGPPPAEVAARLSTPGRPLAVLSDEQLTGRRPPKDPFSPPPRARIPRFFPDCPPRRVVGRQPRRERCESEYGRTLWVTTDPDGAASHPERLFASDRFRAYGFVDGMARRTAGWPLDDPLGIRDGGPLEDLPDPA